MNHDEKNLWAKLQQFPLDAPVALPFSARLAQENRWPAPYAQRVLAEYKKFVFLACTCPGGASPSAPVDAAWHLHLTYTQAYWGAFCRDTLGRELHHVPTQGGPAEAQKHQSGYARTLAHYRATFGQEPPADIWPAPGTRLPARAWVTVDPRTHWVVPKPGPRAWRNASLIGLIFVAGLSIQAFGDLVGYILTAVVVLGMLYVVVEQTGLRNRFGRTKPKKKPVRSAGTAAQNTRPDQDDSLAYTAMYLASRDDESDYDFDNGTDDAGDDESGSDGSWGDGGGSSDSSSSDSGGSDSSCSSSCSSCGSSD
jgi:hypothetical protein